MTIGQLSRRTGVPIKILRKYEDLGFLSTLGRSESNYRLFGENGRSRKPSSPICTSREWTRAKKTSVSKKGAFLMGGMMQGMSLMMFWMSLGGLLFAAVLVIVVVLLARWMMRSPTRAPFDQKTASRSHQEEISSQGGEESLPTSSPVYEPLLVQYPQSQE